MSAMKSLRALSAYLLPRRHRLRNGIVLAASGRDPMLETLCVVAIVGLLLAVTARSYTPMLKRFMLIEAASLTIGYKVRIAEALADQGVMPEMLETSEVATPTRPRHFDELAWQDGEIVFTLRATTSAGMLPEGAMAGAPPLALSFRFARSATGNRLVLLCGLAEPPPGFTAAPARHTTVPTVFLPAHCRI
jgi:type II secretory pathway pseudopilin PulG